MDIEKASPTRPTCPEKSLEMSVSFKSTVLVNYSLPNPEVLLLNGFKAIIYSVGQPTKYAFFNIINGKVLTEGTMDSPLRVFNYGLDCVGYINTNGQLKFLDPLNNKEIVAFPKTEFPSIEALNHIGKDSGSAECHNSQITICSLPLSRSFVVSEVVPRDKKYTVYLHFFGKDENHLEFRLKQQFISESARFVVCSPNKKNIVVVFLQEPGLDESTGILYVWQVYHEKVHSLQLFYMLNLANKPLFLSASQWGPYRIIILANLCEKREIWGYVVNLGQGFMSQSEEVKLVEDFGYKSYKLVSLDGGICTGVVKTDEVNSRIYLTRWAGDSFKVDVFKIFREEIQGTIIGSSVQGTRHFSAENNEILADPLETLFTVFNAPGDSEINGMTIEGTCVRFQTTLLNPKPIYFYIMTKLGLNELFGKNIFSEILDLLC